MVLETNFSEGNIVYLEIDSHRSDTVLVNGAERMFQNIFTEVTLPMENNPDNVCTNSINSLSLYVSNPMVCWCLYSLSSMKNLKNKNCIFAAVFLISFLQAKDSTEQLNLIFPGSLVFFKKEIGRLFEKYMSILCRKHRFEKSLAKLKSNLFLQTAAM